MGGAVSPDSAVAFSGVLQRDSRTVLRGSLTVGGETREKGVDRRLD